MKDAGLKFEADRADPLDRFEDELFRDRTWTVLVVLWLCALVGLVIWR